MTVDVKSLTIVAVVLIFGMIVGAASPALMRIGTLYAAEGLLTSEFGAAITRDDLKSGRFRAMRSNDRSVGRVIEWYFETRLKYQEDGNA